jgi:hypothetical protein
MIFGETDEYRFNGLRPQRSGMRLSDSLYAVPVPWKLVT